ncbi:MAG TPA: hypothetical protein VHO01_05825 [Jatrophihabitans sp.]|nr:hypothetical protein [Jatrophihabitans sp.]
MRTVMERRPRLFRGGAAACVLAALVASLAILSHPVGAASAATLLGSTPLQVVHGCDVGDGQGDWVEATINPNTHVIDPANPPVVQVGLAVSVSDSDAYLTPSGPVLVALASRTTVRLSGPIHGAHVFVRQFGGSAPVLATVAVPTTCRHVAKTNLGDIEVDPYTPHHAASCVGANASLNVKLMNSGDPTQVTVLLVGSSGNILAPASQGQLVALPGDATKTVQVSQPYTSTDAHYHFQVRVLTLDGQGTDSGVQTVVCDAQGHQGGGPSAPPPHPSVSRSVTPPPASSPAPSKPASSHGPTTTSAPVSQPAVSSARNTSSRSQAVVPPAGNGGGDPVVVGSVGSDTGGPVLGDADSIRQPAPPTPSVVPPNKRILISQAVVTGAGTSGFVLTGALVLLAFGAATAGMVAASRASARRR